MARNAFYAQSGGVTAVINASACGVLQTARQHSDEFGKCYAGRNGIIGALTEDLIDTSIESDNQPDWREARPQVPLGGGRLSPAVGEPHRLWYRCRAGLRSRPRSGGICHGRKE